ncbi:MAG: ParB/RepB/Spo0J family partition protein [Planctomycetaceae bacterium]|nr:ParB/RepB/Spo0J family partition protein [Planctomycetaceae bacterium]
MRGNQPGRCAVGDSWISWQVADSVIQIWPRMQTPGDDVEAMDEVEILELVRSIYQIPAAAVEPKRPSLVEAVTSKPAAAAGGPDVRNIPVELIDRFPLNPRDELEFDEESLRELGGELKQRQVQACVVRARGDRFELIAGERRYRAAKLCKLPTLRCEVVDVGDAEAVWMCGQENERRKDWSAIAKARWYRELKKAEGLTDEQLAKRVGVSQGQVTSIMGLLDLPEDWQRRVISQEISATAVRALIPWAKKRPQVLDQVATELRLPGSKAKAARTTDEAITVREVEDALMASLEKCTRCMNPDGYVRDAPLFSISKKVRESLDLEKLKIHRWSNGAESRAWNVAEWDRLQAEAKKRRKANGKPTTRSPFASYPPRDVFRSYTLSQSLEDWLRQVLRGRLPSAPRPIKDRCVLLALFGHGSWEIKDQLTGRSGDLWTVLSGLADDAVMPTLFDAAMEVFDDAFEDAGVADLAAVGKALGIDWGKEFKPSKEMLEAWPLDDLKKFPNAPKDAADKQAAIETLLAKWKAGFIPKQARKLLGLKAGKGAV